MPITTEDLVSSLLSIGYDKVDAALFTSAKSNITSNKKFKFEDYSIKKFFNSYIDFTGTFFKIKDELKDSGSSINMILNRNNELTNYLISKGFGATEPEEISKPKTKALVMKSSN